MKPIVSTLLLSTMLCIGLSPLAAQHSGVTIRDVILLGELTPRGIEFQASATVEVLNCEGATLDVLAGEAALLGTPDLGRGRLRYSTNGIYEAHFSGRGTFPITMQFLIKRHQNEAFNEAMFQFLSAPVRRLELRGFPDDDEVNVAHAAEGGRVDGVSVFNLAPGSDINIRWQSAGTESAVDAFQAIDQTSIAVISPGMIKLNVRMQIRVLQGKVTELDFDFEGDGDVLQVVADDILSWEVTAPENEHRRLIVRFTRAQENTVMLSIGIQCPLARFPASFELPRIVARNAARSGGHLLVVSDGAVSLDLRTVENVSQISPESVPLPEVDRAILDPESRQIFAFRYVGNDYRLILHAQDILPEVTASTLSIYHLGQSSSTVTAEINLDIHAAPLRELRFALPADFSLVGLEGRIISDSHIRDEEGKRALTVAFKEPIIGQHILRLNLDRNDPILEPQWIVPSILPLDVNELRGYVGVRVKPGLRASATEVSGLTEMIPSYFPVKHPAVQLAFRITDPTWNATLALERLESAIQAESFHLFSIGNGISYNSTIVTYQISGAPIQQLSLSIPETYENIEILGRDIRSWRRVGDRYAVDLHSPISATYSLLITSESRLTDDALGEFAGVRPLDALAENGYVLVISHEQTDLVLDHEIANLTSIAPQELPADYQLLVDAPIIAAFHYPTAPQAINARVTTLRREPSIDQVVEMAELRSTITKKGEVLSTAHLAVRSKNREHIAFQLPEGARLWDVSVNGSQPLLVRDDNLTLIPLDDSNDDQTQQIQIRFASKLNSEDNALIKAPVLSAPVNVLRWTVQSDDGVGIELIDSHGITVEQKNETQAPRIIRSSIVGKHLVLIAFLIVSVIAIRALRGCFRRGRFLPRLLLAIGTSVSLIGLLAIIALSFEVDASPGPMPERPIVMEGTVLPEQASLSCVLLLIENEHEGDANPWLGLGAALLAGLIVSGIMQRFSKGGPIGFIVRACIHGFVALILLAFSFGWFLSYIGAIMFGPMLIDALRRMAKMLWAVAAQPGPRTALLMLAVLLFLSGAGEADAATTEPLITSPITLNVQVTNEAAIVATEFNWNPTENDVEILLLSSPAVILELSFPEKGVVLEQRSSEDNIQYFLKAPRKGTYPIRLKYQVPVFEQSDVWRFTLLSVPSLVYKASLHLERPNAEILSDAIVGIESVVSGEDGSMRATAHLEPRDRIDVICRPPSRDTRREQVQFYGESVHAYIGRAGSIEGVHAVTLRIAQGETRVVRVTIPPGTSILGAEAAWLDLWRFDPEARVLEVSASSSLRGQVRFQFRTQTNMRPLPYSGSIALPRLADATSDVGWVGLFSPEEVQFDVVSPSDALAPASLADFPLPDGVDPETRLRRAYRFAEPSGQVDLAASAVQPELRVTTEEMTSLGEDRTLHTATYQVQILRSGLFALRLKIPAGYEIESISGPDLSHWNEMGEGDNRSAVLHLKRRMMGNTTIHATIVGRGIDRSVDWEPPRLTMADAARFNGRLIIAPELGLNLELLDRKGISQVEVPRQPNVEQTRLGFRLLDSEWTLRFSIEPQEPWIECMQLQAVTVTPGRLDMQADLFYLIRNAGMREVRLRIPGEQTAVRFDGDHIANYQRSSEDSEVWTIRFDRRIIGQYKLRVRFQRPVPQGTDLIKYAGIEDLGSQVIQTYLTLNGRNRVRVATLELPSALVPIEWNQLPEEIQHPAGKALATFRVLSRAFSLPLKIVRLDAQDVLPARVRNVRLRTLLSNTGGTFTEAVFSIEPGHKRNLAVRLPNGAHFWSAYVDMQPVWPAVQSDTLLIPLDGLLSESGVSNVEILYVVDPTSETNAVPFSLQGPMCDLPLENIEWTVVAPTHTELIRWSGTLDLVRTRARLYHLDFGSFLERDGEIRQYKRKTAEDLLKLGSSLSDRGDVVSARKALENAYQLSFFDHAFNEDARVQLESLKIQQAMVGLTGRRNAIEQGAELEPVSENTISRTKEDAEYLLALNSAEENQSLQALVRRLIQHQNSATSRPAGLRLTIPEKGTIHTFKRGLQAEPWQPMQVDLVMVEPGRSLPSASFFLALLALPAGTLGRWFRFPINRN